MDVIESCLLLAPVPWLCPAFKVFSFMYESVKGAQASKLQLRDLAERAARLLVALNKAATTGSSQETVNGSSPLLDDLQR